MGFKAEMTLSLLDTELIILKLLKLVRNYSFICLFPKYLMTTYYGSNSVRHTEQGFCICGGHEYLKHTFVSMCKHTFKNANPW